MKPCLPAGTGPQCFRGLDGDPELRDTADNEPSSPTAGQGVTEHPSIILMSFHPPQTDSTRPQSLLSPEHRTHSHFEPCEMKGDGRERNLQKPLIADHNRDPASE